MITRGARRSTDVSYNPPGLDQLLDSRGLARTLDFRLPVAEQRPRIRKSLRPRVSKALQQPSPRPAPCHPNTCRTRVADALYFPFLALPASARFLRKGPSWLRVLNPLPTWGTWPALRSTVSTTLPGADLILRPRLSRHPLDLAAEALQARPGRVSPVGYLRAHQRPEW